MLILSHREELVEQPRKYFDCSYGIERAQQHSHGEEVVSASIQTLVRRLDQFDPEDFRLIICDEAHHAAASTYRKIFDHFRPEKLIGFTATPNRGDKVRLDTVFSKIIFQRDLRWGVQNGYLCNIHCRRVDIGFDLSAVHTRRGDYAPGELDEAMDGTADAIAEAYYSYFKPQFEAFGIKCDMLNWTNTYGKPDHDNHAKALAMLQEGYYLIALMNKGLWTSSGHFVVVWWADNKIHINDPASTRKVRTEGDPETFRSQVKYYWWVDARAYNQQKEAEEDVTHEEWMQHWYELRKSLQDNDSSAYSEEARKWAQKVGLITGNGAEIDGEPNCMWEDVLTREQFATVLYRFAKIIGKA